MNFEALHRPLRRRKYKNFYNLHRRGLGISVKGTKFSKTVLKVINSVGTETQQLDSDDTDFDDDEEELQEVYERLLGIYVRTVAEKVYNGPPPVNPITIRIEQVSDLHDNCAEKYRFRTKNHLYRVF